MNRPTKEGTIHANPHRTFAVVLLALYGLGVLTVLMWPTPVDSSMSSSLKNFFAWCAAHGMGWVTYRRLEFAANIALFVPLGFLLTLASRRLKWWHVIGGAALASMVAEITQALARPERFATASDVVANTLGAALGLVVALAYRAARSAATAPPTP